MRYPLSLEPDLRGSVLVTGINTDITEFHNPPKPEVLEQYRQSGLFSTNWTDAEHRRTYDRRDGSIGTGREDHLTLTGRAVTLSNEALFTNLRLADAQRLATIERLKDEQDYSALREQTATITPIMHGSAAGAELMTIPELCISSTGEWTRYGELQYSQIGRLALGDVTDKDIATVLIEKDLVRA